MTFTHLSKRELPKIKQINVDGVRHYETPDGTFISITSLLKDYTPEGILEWRENVGDDVADHVKRNATARGNKVHKIILRLPPTSNAFHKGHKIRLEISSSDFPHFDRNANTGKEFDSAENSRIAKQKIYHSAQYPSRIVLPIIPIKN